MANQITINIGANANDGTGEPLRSAFNDVNLNFANVWSTGLPNSNVQFDNNRVLTVNTNADLVLAPNGVGKVVSNVNVLPNSANLLTLGSESRRWNTVYTQYLNLSGPSQLVVYSSTEERDNAVPTPSAGMMIYVADVGVQVYGATQWNTIANSNL